MAHLTDEVRRYAFQMLGPPPEPPAFVAKDRPAPASPSDPLHASAASRERRPNASEKAAFMPRHQALKLFAAWLDEQNITYLSLEQVRERHPDFAKLGTLDFVFLREPTYMAVTVRPQFRSNQLQDMRRWQQILGPNYHAIRVWLYESPERTTWREFPVQPSGQES